MPKQPRAAFGSNSKRYDSHTDILMPTAAQKSAVRMLRKSSNKISKYNRLQIPNAEENLNRLLTLKRDLCCYPGCPRKHIYWTPRGKYCGVHKEEAMKAMAIAKRVRYGS